MEYSLCLELDELLRAVEIGKNDTYTMLLGAGASISSGIQSAYDCIWEWKKDIYISKNTNSSEWIENYKIDHVKEIIQRWLDSEGIFLPANHPEEYSYYIEKCYPIEDDRRKYFQKISENKEPSIGYHLLCLMAQAGIIQSVWTTNFDNLTLNAAILNNITAIDVTLDKVDRILRSQNKKELLHIGLHGDYRYGQLKNTTQELKDQDKIFRDKFIEYLNDKHLIVVGYSGRDKSLMDTLKESYSRKGAGRLYWCGYGRDAEKSVQELIKDAKANGRSAFYIPTDGFDKLMIKLARICLRDNEKLSIKMKECLKTGKEEYINTPFKLDCNHINNVIKSNSFPIILPKEIFQFEMALKENEKIWSLIRELTLEKNVVAVPYKGNIWALGTLTDIHQCFEDRIKDNRINRKPVVDINLKRDTILYYLFISALTRVLANQTSLKCNGKNLIWRTESRYTKQEIINGNSYKVYQGIKLSLDYTTSFYLTLNPSFYVEVENGGRLPDEVRKIIGKKYYDKLWNHRVNDYINEWRKVLFENKNSEVEFPLNSGTGLIFRIFHAPAFATVMNSGSVRGITLNPRFSSKLIKYHGIQYKEPQLIFSPRHKEMQQKAVDSHPMRGLSKNQPYDFPLSGTILKEEIKLSIICPKTEAQLFYNFISQQIRKIDSKGINKDYLINYPGFHDIYGISLNIPDISSQYWLDCPEPETDKCLKSPAQNLKNIIRSKVDDISRDCENVVIIIFIPDRWNDFLKYSDNHEDYDLHDYIKAFCAEKGIATQFIQENTVRSNLQCQIHWWLSLSFYVKSLRTPWILDQLDKTTAFAGIGYSVNQRNRKNQIILGCSHIYTSQGEGLKYRLSKVEDQIYWDNQKNPHLSYNDAFHFGLSIKELFYIAMNSLPKRVVIHKRTYFTKEEINGIKDSLLGTGVEKIDLIEINFEDNIRFIASKINQNGMPYEADSFAVSRGTCVLLNSKSALLWTHGVVPSVANPKHRYYLGGRYIPAPLKITKHFGESNVGQIASEILGLTKMNWNSLNLYTQLPATIHSSNQIARIGKLLSHREGATYDYRYFI